MMKRIALLILYLSIGLTATSYAGKLPHVSYYRAADGLSSRSVNCISQDEAGFIWIGSENGLDRFDGHHFKHYDIADGRTIYTIYPDHQGKLWLGTGKGVFIFNTENGLSEKFNVETKMGSLSLLESDHHFQSMQHDFHRDSRTGILLIQS